MNFTDLTEERIRTLLSNGQNEHVRPLLERRLRELSSAGNSQAARLPRRSSVPNELQREKDVEQDIDAELVRLGFDVTRLSQPRRSMQTEGIPDRYARHVAKRMRLWIEVKQPGGTVSADQKRWHKTERAAGGDVITVWSVQDLHEELEARGLSC